MRAELGQFKFSFFEEIESIYVHNIITPQISKLPKSRSLPILQGHPPEITKTIFIVFSNFWFISFKMSQNSRLWNFSKKKLLKNQNIINAPNHRSLFSRNQIYQTWCMFYHIVVFRPFSRNFFAWRSKKRNESLKSCIRVPNFIIYMEKNMTKMFGVKIFNSSFSPCLESMPPEQCPKKLCHKVWMLWSCK